MTDKTELRPCHACGSSAVEYLEDDLEIEDALTDELVVTHAKIARLTAELAAANERAKRYKTLIANAFLKGIECGSYQGDDLSSPADFYCQWLAEQEKEPEPTP